MAGILAIGSDTPRGIIQGTEMPASSPGKGTAPPVDTKPTAEPDDGWPPLPSLKAIHEEIDRYRRTGVGLSNGVIPTYRMRGVDWNRAEVAALGSALREAEAEQVAAREALGAALLVAYRQGAGIRRLGVYAGIPSKNKVRRIINGAISDEERRLRSGSD